MATVLNLNPEKNHKNLYSFASNAKYLVVILDVFEHAFDKVIFEVQFNRILIVELLTGTERNVTPPKPKHHVVQSYRTIVTGVTAALKDVLNILPIHLLNIITKVIPKTIRSTRGEQTSYSIACVPEWLLCLPD